ncbi:DUF4357 domain-containing protein [Nocardia otitidiscaviarum]|uniref:DUF4357 domain-containing protein n=1 Tax=Nocardia otitidiscaviarum TaxID=1823 RepID=UPI0007C7EEA2|nr:DUF4357 domain-containing protein [Nocardia otitidiscaviarum]MBF6134771.1 DUF4357 domain-containing protein [Nocardia otitidiscaviarum]MBF6485603.1 DUF4357 domain-containing protein [Nocardia otitidiscaviarum]
MSVEAFEIKKPFLRSLLEQAREGQIQLPEFQRGWVWPENNIRSLLGSVSRGFPVGTLMMLQAGGHTRFKQRPIEGVDLVGDVLATQLLLDGQQRITSLYQALMLGRPVATIDERRREVQGWFYVDINLALDDDADQDEAFRFVPADRTIRTSFGRTELDLSTMEGECQASLFPMSQVFDADDWGYQFTKLHNYAPEAIEVWQNFNKRFIKRFEQYLVPVIELPATTPREAVCQVFEKVNTGGVTLTVFELLTATYAADEFNLREHWDQCRMQWSDGKFRVLSAVSETDFLQAVTLLATYRRRETAGTADAKGGPRIGCRRVDMLRLPLDDFKKSSEEIVNGLLMAAKFLHHRNIFDVKFVPYGAQLIPLAAICAALGQAWHRYDVQQKVARWYWCGVFGELYSGTTETRFARDLPDVVDWALGRTSAEPRTVAEAQFAPGRLRTLRTRNSAAYKGVYALLLAGGARDWCSGNPINAATYFDDAIDIHHVFPQAWCAKQSLDRGIYDSVINKTPLSAYTNRHILGGSAPSSYLAKLTAMGAVDAPALRSHVATHLINPDVLLHDDFDTFIAQREAVLLDLIATAMDSGFTHADESNQVPTEELIAEGESHTVEFKASAFLDLRTNQAEAERRYIIVRTVCGFLNADGGSLFIGVEDDGNPVGLEGDMRSIKVPDLDKYELRLREMIENHLSTTTAATVRVEFPAVSGKKICQVIVTPAIRPVFLKRTKALGGKGEVEFCVRRGNATVLLQGDHMERYKEEHWGHHALPRMEPEGQLGDTTDIDHLVSSPEFEMRVDGLLATAQIIDGDFTVRAGSQVRPRWTAGEHSYRGLRIHLEKVGVITVSSDGRTAVFTRDYQFKAPSAAAAMVVGRPTNGRTDWRLRGTATTFAEWERGAKGTD